MMNKQEFYNKVTEQTGIELSEKQKNQYQRYYELVVEWNQKINLTAITEEEEFYSKHFYDSISLAFFKDYSNVDNICDVGSGAGFPSIPLKILYPNLEVTIVDSLNKRIKFLNLLKDELELTNCNFIHARAEEIKCTFRIMFTSCKKKWILFKFEGTKSRRRNKRSVKCDKVAWW